MDTTACPEYESIEAFAEYLFDDERKSFTHVELNALAAAVQLSAPKVRKELESYGLGLAERPKEREVHGINFNPHNRWTGENNATHGGSGWSQIIGFAGVAHMPSK